MAEIGTVFATLVGAPFSWQPTAHLRWRNGVLEQCWVGRSLTNGTQEWRPIDVVDESSNTVYDARCSCGRELPQGMRRCGECQREDEDKQ